MDYTESILNSIKKMLGPSAEYTHFDPDIIMHINSAFADLNRIGVGPSEGFNINDSSAKWTDFVSDISKIENIKTYVYLNVKLVFDPPTNSSILSSYERKIDKLEWALNVAADNSSEV